MSQWLLTSQDIKGKWIGVILRATSAEPTDPNYRRAYVNEDAVRLRVAAFPAAGAAWGEIESLRAFDQEYPVSNGKHTWPGPGQTFMTFNRYERSLSAPGSIVEARW
jgi:hypothetical protein